MASKQQFESDLNELNTTLTNVSAAVDKVGTETTTLVEKVAALEAEIANGNVTPAIEAAFQAVKAQAATVASKIKTVDDLVPDPIA